MLNLQTAAINIKPNGGGAPNASLDRWKGRCRAGGAGLRGRFRPETGLLVMFGIDSQGYSSPESAPSGCLSGECRNFRGEQQSGTARDRTDAEIPAMIVCKRSVRLLMRRADTSLYVVHRRVSCSSSGAIACLPERVVALVHKCHYGLLRNPVRCAARERTRALAALTEGMLDRNV